MDTRNYERMRRSVADAPGTSFWLKFSVEALHNRDPLDAVNDAQDLLDICQARAAAVDEAYPGIAHDFETMRQQRDELVKTLRAIVALDDGDKPALWRFEAEFNAARAALAKVRP